MTEPLRKVAKEEVEKEIFRTKPEIDTILLDDISRGIKQVVKRLEAQVPEGFKDEVTVSVSGTNPVPMQPKRTKPPYFRATVFSDGPDPVYVFLNDVKPEAIREAPLNQGDKIDIDTTEAKIQALFFACTTATGNASLRIHLLK